MSIGLKTQDLENPKDTFVFGIFVWKYWNFMGSTKLFQRNNFQFLRTVARYDKAKQVK